MQQEGRPHLLLIPVPDQLASDAALLFHCSFTPEINRYMLDFVAVLSEHAAMVLRQQRARSRSHPHTAAASAIHSHSHSWVWVWFTLRRVTPVTSHFALRAVSRHSHHTAEPQSPPHQQSQSPRDLRLDLGLGERMVPGQPPLVLGPVGVHRAGRRFPWHARAGHHRCRTSSYVIPVSARGGE